MTKNNKYSLAIIILNYKTPALVIDCLHSLKKEIMDNSIYVVVVDNLSKDDSIDLISKAIADNSWSTWVKLVASNINGGFSAGNNLGISSIIADYYLLLNSDTLVTKGSVIKLLKFAQENPHIGLVTPNLIWPEGKLQTSSFRNIHPISEFLRTAKTGFISKLLKKYNTAISPGSDITFPDWICFASVVIKKSVIEKIGKLDDEYFMYFEDVDYCRRARQQGFIIANYTGAEIIHLNGGSSGINSKKSSQNKALPDYYYASRERYFKKYYGNIGFYIANFCWLAGRTISFLREKVQGKNISVSKNEIYKIWRNH